MLNKFFVATPLDFEQACLREMKEIWPFLLGKDAKPHGLEFPDVKVLEGGLEFETELFIGVQFNFFLKTANRVLLRLLSFKAKDLPKFYQKFKSLPWIDMLPNGSVEWQIAAQKSRLNNEKRLLESASKALEEIFGKDVPAEPCATIYIRMDDDLCTISLDSTGEHLHKRGWSVLKGDAPLRETIAAFLLEEMIGKTPASELAKISLVDPMTGAGTFLTEARALRFPQFQRPFAFQKWKNAPKLFLSPSFGFNYQLPDVSLFKAYIGMDNQADMIEVAEKNFAEVETQLKAYQRAGFIAAPVKFLHQDALTAENPAEAPLWMVVNPPYGERLPIAGGGSLHALVQEFCTRYKPAKLGVLYPEKERLSGAMPGYRIEKQVRVNNGGLRCLFNLLTRQ